MKQERIMNYNAYLLNYNLSLYIHQNHSILNLVYWNPGYLTSLRIALSALIG